MKLLLILPAFLLLTNYSNSNAYLQTQKHIAAPLQTGKGKPDKADVLLIIMESYYLQLPLTDPNCGRDLNDVENRTLGKFLIRYWKKHAEFNDNNQNFLNIEVVEGAHPNIHEKHWWIYFEIWGKKGDADPWSGGVRFYVLDRNWKIVQETIECYAG